MVEPVLRVCSSVKPRRLYVYLLVCRIKVDISDRCRLASLRVGDADAWKVRWDDQVDVLTGGGEDAEHAEEDKGSHSTAVIVTGYALNSIVEHAGNVLMSLLRRQTWSTSIVIEKRC